MDTDFIRAGGFAEVSGSVFDDQMICAAIYSVYHGVGIFGQIKRLCDISVYRNLQLCGWLLMQGMVDEKACSGNHKNEKDQNQFPFLFVMETPLSEKYR